MTTHNLRQLLGKLVTTLWCSSNMFHLAEIITYYQDTLPENFSIYIYIYTIIWSYPSNFNQKTQGIDNLTRNAYKFLFYKSF